MGNTYLSKYKVDLLLVRLLILFSEEQLLFSSTFENDPQSNTSNEYENVKEEGEEMNVLDKRHTESDCGMNEIRLTDDELLLRTLKLFFVQAEQSCT